jgi:hypothetical protein
VLLRDVGTRGSAGNHYQQMHALWPDSIFPSRLALPVPPPGAAPGAAAARAQADPRSSPWLIFGAPLAAAKISSVVHAAAQRGAVADAKARDEMLLALGRDADFDTLVAVPAAAAGLGLDALLHLASCVSANGDITHGALKSGLAEAWLRNQIPTVPCSWTSSLDLANLQFCAGVHAAVRNAWQCVHLNSARQALQQSLDRDVEYSCNVARNGLRRVITEALQNDFRTLDAMDAAFVAQMRSCGVATRRALGTAACWELWCPTYLFACACLLLALSQRGAPEAEATEEAQTVLGIAVARPNQCEPGMRGDWMPLQRPNNEQLVWLYRGPNPAAGTPATWAQRLCSPSVSQREYRTHYLSNMSTPPLADDQLIVWTHLEYECVQELLFVNARLRQRRQLQQLQAGSAAGLKQSADEQVAALLAFLEKKAEILHEACGSSAFEAVHRIAKQQLADAGIAVPAAPTTVNAQ